MHLLLTKPFGLHLPSQQEHQDIPAFWENPRRVRLKKVAPVSCRLAGLDDGLVAQVIFKIHASVSQHIAEGVIKIISLFHDI